MFQTNPRNFRLVHYVMNQAQNYRAVLGNSKFKMPYLWRCLSISRGIWRRCVLIYRN